MANQEHLQWLLEGADSWNNRRRQMDFVPDLTGVDIFEAFYGHRKLDSDGLIPLAEIDLSDADMTDTVLAGHTYLDGRKNHPIPGVNLKKANLKNAKICNATLAGADLVKANLQSADLSSANLDYSDLAEANLSYTNLKSALLRGANLTNAILSGTSLWEAKIFREESNKKGLFSKSERLCNQKQNLECIENLLDICRELNKNYPDHVLYFRGERTNEWELRPSVMRHTEKGKANLLERERVMLRNLRSRRPGDFLHASSALDEWVLARHHGLPTRLLDITRNPLVALYWASQENEQDDPQKPGRLHLFSVPRNMIEPFDSDEICLLTTFAKLPRYCQELLLGKFLPNSTPLLYRKAIDDCYELIQQEKPYFKDRLDPIDFFRVFVVEPQQSFERIRAQSGAFLISAYHERFERKEVIKVNPETPIYNHIEFEIPHKYKQAARNDLRLLNITRETLMPGLDEAASAVAQEA